MSQASEERLSKREIGFYSIVWIGVIFYSIYEVYLTRNDHAIFGIINESDGLAPGWQWIGGIREVGDTSWVICIGFLKQLIPWLFIQLLISQTLKHMKIHETLIYSFYIIYTGAFLWNYCGYDGLRYLLYAPCLMCFFKFFSDKLLMNIIILIIALKNPYSPRVIDLISPISAEPHKFFMLKIAFDWTLLRAMGCRAESGYDESHKNFKEFIKIAIRSIAYCWYLPTLFMGPHITYVKFIKSVEGPQERWTSRRMIVKLLNLMRFIFWMYFTEFIMHFVYAHAISIELNAVMNLNTWAFYGLVFCLGQYFYLQYLVIYGITGEISRADNIEAPPPPKCIARIHLYSDMWRHFDRGLYEYLVRRIYKRVLKWKIPQSKIVATLLTFLFVLVRTPKIHKVVWITVVLNFIGVMIESIAKSIGNSITYTRFQGRYLSSRNNRRLNCFLATPLLLFSIAVNLHTIQGTQFANHFVDTLFHESPAVIAFLMFTLYCFSHVSTEIKLIEKHRANYDENGKISDETLNG